VTTLLLQTQHTRTQLATICAAFTSLYQLEELTLAYTEISRAAALQLAQLTQLQVLNLSCCGLDDASVLAILMGCQGWLMKLDILGNPAVTDAVLPVLASRLGWMPWDDFSGTSVTYGGWQMFMP